MKYDSLGCGHREKRGESVVAWEFARLIPVSGIKGAEEQERRAVSALLSVVGSVKEFGRGFLKQYGAPAGKIEAFTEVPFDVAGRRVRVDGLIRVTRGKRTWTLIVEAKTGNAVLGRDQIQSYLDLVRQERFDGLLTISNELVPVVGRHPIAVDQRRYGKLPLHHLSWIRILSLAVRIHEHQGVDDPDQAWILGELIRYLRHENSGALALTDMGPSWIAIREAVRAGTLTSTDAGIAQVAERWDQLVQYVCLLLGQRLGRDVQPDLTRRERDDWSLRTADVERELVQSHILTAGIRIPDAVGAISLAADLRTMTMELSVSLGAPDNPRAKSRVSWLLRQLSKASEELRIDAHFPNTKLTTSELLGDVREDGDCLTAPMSRPPRAFTVTRIATVGANRRRGRNSFIDDVASLTDEFYGEVVQNLKSWTPPPPKLRTDPELASTSPGQPETPPERPTDAPPSPSPKLNPPATASPSVATDAQTFWRPRETPRPL